MFSAMILKICRSFSPLLIILLSLLTGGGIFGQSGEEAFILEKVKRNINEPSSVQTQNSDNNHTSSNTHSDEGRIIEAVRSYIEIRAKQRELEYEIDARVVGKVEKIVQKVKEVAPKVEELAKGMAEKTITKKGAQLIVKQLVKQYGEVVIKQAMRRAGFVVDMLWPDTFGISDYSDLFDIETTSQAKAQLIILRDMQKEKGLLGKDTEFEPKGKDYDDPNIDVMEPDANGNYGDETWGPTQAR